MGSFELIAAGQLMAFGAAIGLLLSVMLQPKRGRADGLFILFGLVLLGWSFAALIVDQSVIAEKLRISFLLTGLSGTGFAYFLFVARLMRVENRLFAFLTLILPLVAILTFSAIWTGAIEHLMIRSILLVGLLSYALITFWSILISRESVAPALRPAGLLLGVAYTVPILNIANLETALLLMTAAGLWTGWTVLHFQWRQPIKELQDELRIANADLRRAVAEAADERAHRAALDIEVRRSLQVRTEFLEELGHRLRTTLNSISGYNQLLQFGMYGAVTDSQVDRLQTIGNNNQLLLALINNMLDLNTLEAGRMELRQSPISPKVLFERIAEAVEPQCAAKSLALVVDMSADLGSICVDEGRLMQVLRTLVENAIKFTVQGTITLRAVCVAVQDGWSAQFTLPVCGWLGDGRWVVLSVEDTGIGIALEDQGKIFEPFHQASSGALTEALGSGLSLAVSKRLVERHEGVMWLQSTPGRGSTFHVAVRAFRSDALSTLPSRTGEKETLA